MQSTHPIPAHIRLLIAALAALLLIPALVDRSAAAGAPGDHLWSHAYGSAGPDAGYSVATDPAGNIYLAGYFQNTVDFGGGPLVSAGSADIILAKYDPSGNHLWSRRFGDAGYDEARAVSVDAAGNVLVAGRFLGAVDFGGGPLTAAGGYDVFLARFDGDGQHLWSARYGAATDDNAYAVGADLAGNIFLAGDFQGTVDFGGGPLTSAGGYDVFLARFDAGGSHAWSQRFGGVNGDVANALSVAADGSVVLAGLFSTSADFGGGPLISAGADDVFLARYAAGGAHLWSQRFGGSGADRGQGVATDSRGYVLLTGFFNGTASFGGAPLTSAAMDDIFLARYDAAGAHVWSRRMGGGNNDRGLSVSADRLQNAVVTGYCLGNVNFGGGSLACGNAYNIFLATYDAALGGHLWSRTMGSTTSDYGYGVAVDPANDVLLAGSFSGSANFGGGTLPNAGAADIVLAKYTGIPLPDLALTKTVTPTVDVPEQSEVTYQLILANRSPTTEASAVLTDTLPAGVDFGAWIDNPGAQVVDDQITWLGPVTGTTSITLTFTAQHVAGRLVTNTAEFTSTFGSGSASAVFTVACPAVRSVQNTADSGPGSLRQSLAEVCPGGTVTFDPALSGQTIAPASTLVITQSLTVDATSLPAPVVLDGGDARRVLQVDKQITVTLDSLVITRGRAPWEADTAYRGGGLLIDRGAVVTLTRSSVISNSIVFDDPARQRGYGAGIANYGSLAVISGTLSANALLDPGGIPISATHTFGAAIANGMDDDAGEASLLVRASVLAANSLCPTPEWCEGDFQAEGGAIANHGEGGHSLKIERSAFTGNLARRGGAVTPGRSIWVIDSTFTANRALEEGGAMLLGGKLALVQGSEFTGNTAPLGGAIRAISGALENSTLTGNQATVTGGAIWSDYQLTLKNVTVSGNAAPAGGGVYVATGPLEFYNTILANAGDGGDCYAPSVVASLNNLVEDGSCSADATAFLTGDPHLGQLTAHGGPTATMALLPGSPALDSGDATTCPPADQRGLARPQGAGCDRGAYEAGTLRLDVSSAPATVAPYHGVITYTAVLTNTGPAEDPAAALTVTIPAGLSFEQWTEEPPPGTTQAGSEIGWRGAIAAGQAMTWTYETRNAGSLGAPGDYGDLLLTTARGQGETDLGSWSEHALAVECGPAIVQNLQSTGNCSLRDVLAKAPPGATVTFRPELAGGVLYLGHDPAYPWQPQPNPAITITQDVRIDGSTLPAPITLHAQDAARLLAVTNTASVTLESLVLSHGKLAGAGVCSPDLCGAALVVEAGARATLERSVVESNAADAGGGALANWGVLSVLTSTVRLNTAGAAGGGIFNAGQLTLLDSTLADNLAGAAGVAGQGGGIYNEGDLAVERTTFAANGSGAHPGGTGGSAGDGGDGGALYSLISDTRSVTITNSTFSSNWAAQRGGALHNAAGQVTLHASTFAGNAAVASETAPGGGAYYGEAGRLDFDNTIFAGSPSGGDCVTSGPVGASVANLVEDGSCSAGGVDFRSGAAFLAPLADNGGPAQTIALGPGSPALDSGDAATCPATDQRGTARDATCDRGAYEVSRTAAAAIPTGTQDVVLTWSYALAGLTYEGWRSTEPYLDPLEMASVACTVAEVVTCVDAGAAAAPGAAYFYVVRAAGPGGTLDSTRTGMFNFGLVSE